MLPTVALALRYLQHFSGCANPNGASLREVNDLIGLVLPDGHERTNGIAVVVQMVPGALAGRETAVVAFLQYVRMVPKIERRRALEEEDMLLFLEMVVELIRIFAGPKFIDANSDMRTPGVSAESLESVAAGELLPWDVINVERFEAPFAVLGGRLVRHDGDTWSLEYPVPFWGES